MALRATIKPILIRERRVEKVREITIAGTRIFQLREILDS
jgi:hypothetical protein